MLRDRPPRTPQSGRALPTLMFENARVIIVVPIRTKTRRATDADIRSEVRCV
jgi:hypothetical protein